MIAIIKSTFNSTVTTGLLEGCIKALEEKNISENQIKIFEVPGAFEIPATTNLLVKKQEYGTKTDMWSLGCILYEMLTLRVAFNSLSMAALCKKIKTASYLKLKNYNNYNKKIKEPWKICTEEGGLIQNFGEEAGKIYKGLTHPHVNQNPKQIDFKSLNKRNVVKN